jgi:hypothetical protein
MKKHKRNNYVFNPCEGSNYQKKFTSEPNFKNLNDRGYLSQIVCLDKILYKSRNDLEEIKNYSIKNMYVVR